jgi:hypothetical protein
VDSKASTPSAPTVVLNDPRRIFCLFCIRLILLEMGLMRRHRDLLRRKPRLARSEKTAATAELPFFSKRPHRPEVIRCRGLAGHGICRLRRVLINRDCSTIAGCRKQLVQVGAGSSGAFLPPSPPAEKATDSQDQAGQSTPPAASGLFSYLRGALGNMNVKSSNSATGRPFAFIIIWRGSIP